MAASTNAWRVDGNVVDPARKSCTVQPACHARQEARVPNTRDGRLSVDMNGYEDAQPIKLASTVLIVCYESQIRVSDGNVAASLPEVREVPRRLMRSRSSKSTPAPSAKLSNSIICSEH